MTHEHLVDRSPSATFESPRDFAVAWFFVLSDTDPQTVVEEASLIADLLAYQRALHGKIGVA